MTEPAKFPENFFYLMEAFSREVLLLPEIVGIAIIPLYADGKGDTMIPGGYMGGRSGPLQTPNELLEMGIQISYAQKRIVESIDQLLKHTDDQMGRMAGASRRLLEEIEERSAVLRNQGETK